MNYQELKQNFKEAVELLECLNDNVLKTNLKLQEEWAEKTFNEVKRWTSRFLNKVKKQELSEQSIYKNQVTIQFNRR